MCTSKLLSTHCLPKVLHVYNSFFSFPTYWAMYQRRKNKSQPLLLHRTNLYRQNYRDILVATSPLVWCFSSDKIKGIWSGIGFRPANLPHHFLTDQMTGFLQPNQHPCNIVSRLRLYPVLVSHCLPLFSFLLDVSHSSGAAQWCCSSEPPLPYKTAS